ncbi:methyltransferase [Colwellia psychrerythraea]|uniref:Ribosomal RNA small subunit methyltransferase C n=1 Tax=Colwellia psychrerythraea TaxID=28229 RepID=A0A099KKE8_COLPS|nr:methyltransferase [Colwellia psychrerythraea]KGJ91279.1 Ribosomal RNA small subunit methyltransferase C [Colwellia psychrerythraea]
MSLSNPSQVLLRNSELLVAKTPLFINLPEDGFIDAYLELYKPNSINCFNNNFIDYQAIINKHRQTATQNVQAIFSSTYQTKIYHDLVIITFPKSKAELNFTLAMIAHCIDVTTKILLVGEKKGGIQSAPKLTKDLLSCCQKADAARHCLLFAGLFQPEKLSIVFNLQDWFKKYKITVEGIELTIASLPGVFSQKKLDTGTALLLGNLPEKMSGKVLDFGCGAGVISCFIGKKFTAINLSLLDVSALALTSAQESLALNGLLGQVFPSNSLSDVNEQYQYVVSNPPFHQGVKTHYQASEEFLAGINKKLSKRGNITIVANSFLRYQPIMQAHIGDTRVITKEQGFTIYQAQLSSK